MAPTPSAERMQLLVLLLMAALAPWQASVQRAQLLRLMVRLLPRLLLLRLLLLRLLVALAPWEANARCSCMEQVLEVAQMAGRANLRPRRVRKLQAGSAQLSMCLH